MWVGEGVWAHEGADIPLPSPPEETPPGGQHADSWGPLGPANWLTAGVWQDPFLGLPTLEARGSRLGDSRRLAPWELSLAAGRGAQQEVILLYFFFFFLLSPTTGSELLSPGASGRSLWQVALWLRSAPEG